MFCSCSLTDFRNYVSTGLEEVLWNPKSQEDYEIIRALIFLTQLQHDQEGPDHWLGPYSWNDEAFAGVFEQPTNLDFLLFRSNRQPPKPKAVYEGEPIGHSFKEYEAFLVITPIKISFQFHNTKIIIISIHDRVTQEEAIP